MVVAESGEPRVSVGQSESRKFENRPRLRAIVASHQHGDYWQAFGAVAGATVVTGGPSISTSHRDC